MHTNLGGHVTCTKLYIELVDIKIMSMQLQRSKLVKNHLKWINSIEFLLNLSSPPRF